MVVGINGFAEAAATGCSKRQREVLTVQQNTYKTVVHTCFIIDNVYDYIFTLSKLNEFVVIMCEACILFVGNGENLIFKTGNVPPTSDCPHG